MIDSFFTNLRLELLLRKSRVSSYIYFLLMLTIGVLIMLFSAGFFSEVNVVVGSSKAALNGPVKLHGITSFISVIGLLICGPIFGQTVCKDYEAKIDQIVFATPTHRIGFYLGRFCGAILLSLLIYTGFALGHWLASYTPGLQRSLLQEPRFIYYFMPYLTAVLPNILIFGSLFFTIAALTRRMGSVYVGGILLFLGYLFAGSFAREVDYRLLRALVDPFGMSSINLDTEYWSPFDQNTRLVGLHGYVLINRLVWMAISGFLFIVGLLLTQKDLRLKSKKASDPAPVAKAATPVRWQAATLAFDARSRLALLGRQIRFEIAAAFKNIFFLCLALAGVIFLFTNARYFNQLDGTKLLPVTYNILEGSLSTFLMFLTAIIIFYTGELLWRERQYRMQQILDALPQPDWVPLVSKFLALQVLILALLAMIAVCGMIVQLFYGYTNFELGQVFITQFTIAYPHFMILSAIVLFIHVLVDNKYVGHTVAAAFAIAQPILPSIGVEHDMLIPGAVKSFITYSDMNGYGPFPLSVRSYELYWGFFAGGLLVMAYLYWPFGTDSALALRKKLAGQRWNKPLAWVTTVLVAGFVGAGSFIYYNTMVLNEFHRSSYFEKQQLAYEKTYKAEWDRKDQLVMVAVNAQVDITPELPALKATMDYTLENIYQHPIDTLFLNAPKDRKFYSLEFDKGAPQDTYDEYLNVHILRFAEPIPPGGQVHMKYTFDYQPRGFPEKGQELRLVRNGTFFDSTTFFPYIGYSRDRELDSDKDREKHGLAPKPTANPISDEAARAFTYIGRSGNWIRFEATVSTTGDQIALAPGYLEKEWREGDRHYFHYKMDHEILNFYAFISAHYATKTAQWNDIPITIYFDPKHPYNVDTMIQGSKDGLDYFTKNFGPYQFRQFRIMEFPRYQSFAQSFPNTVPFAESMGFIAKANNPEDPDDFDYPYFVTAHELAHQWWAHQVIGGDVQGSTVLVETLAQYSAAMIIEKKHGREKVERLLRHENRRYFFGRTTESKREWPLALNEGQSYIHYGKGVSVMYALKEVVGEDALNAAIKKFADGVRFQKPPFTTGVAFVESLKANLDPKYSPIIDDLFMKVILYDNRIQSHKVTEEKDGSVTVDLEIFGRKLDVDAKGEQKETDFELDMEIAGRGADEKFMPGTHHVIKAGVNKIQLRFAKKPQSILLDPVGMWIDTNREDNKVKL